MKNVIKNIGAGYEAYDEEHNLVSFLFWAGAFFLILLMATFTVAFIRMSVNWEAVRFIMLLTAATYACFCPLYKRGKSLDQGDK